MFVFLFCASLGGAALVALLQKLDSYRNGSDARMLRARIAELEHSLHHLEDAANRREEFIASFAHELKTPLTAIIGYADMLRSKDMAPKPGLPPPATYSRRARGWRPCPSNSWTSSWPESKTLRNAALTPAILSGVSQQSPCPPSAAMG
jgi:signal transduction histidine kinase